MKPLLESRDVTVLIVNYRGADDTINCLRSLHNLVEAPGRIIVIDNNSNDGSVDKIFFAWSKFAAPTIVKAENIEQAQPKSHAVILMMPKNGGYAYGNNAGMRLAFRDSACKAVWVLNNDTEADSRALYELCKKVSTEKCIVGSTLVYHHDKKTVQCLGGSKINKLLGTTSHICEGMNIDKVHAIDVSYVENKLDALNGASMLIQKNIIQCTGYLNEKYFLYYEDIEFCVRSKKNGIELLWSPYSIVYHKEGASSRRYAKRSDLIGFYILRNRLFFMQAHYPFFIIFALISYILIIIKRSLYYKRFYCVNIIKSIYHGIVKK